MQTSGRRGATGRQTTPMWLCSLAVSSIAASQCSALLMVSDQYGLSRERWELVHCKIIWLHIQIFRPHGRCYITVYRAVGSVSVWQPNPLIYLDLVATAEGKRRSKVTARSDAASTSTGSALSSPSRILCEPVSLREVCRKGGWCIRSAYYICYKKTSSSQCYKYLLGCLFVFCWQDISH